MLESKFFLYKVRVDPETGEDAITLQNPDSVPYNERELEDALRELYNKEAATAEPDDGVMVQKKRRLFSSPLTDPFEELSYEQLGERLGIIQKVR